MILIMINKTLAPKITKTPKEMKTEHEYETFGPEWRASLKGMSKAHIIELFSKVGKEKEKLEEINAELLEALKPFEKCSLRI